MAFSAAVREQIFNNANGKCEKCDKQIVLGNHTRGERGAWQAHHKNHVASGGTNTASNGRALCLDCHSGLHA